MSILIGTSANRCTGTCVASEGIISWRAKIRNAGHITAERMTTIKTTTTERRATAITIVKYTAIVTARTTGRSTIIVAPTPIMRRFRIICLQLSRYLPVHGKTKEKEKIKHNQATYVYHDSKCCNQYKESKCEKDRTFLKLLHSNFFNIFNYNFRHHISRFVHLTYLKYRRIQKATQEIISFCIYKCIYKYGIKRTVTNHPEE